MPPSPSRQNNRPKAPARLKAEKFGRRAEWLAALYLRCQLFSIRAKRFKTPVGEIDLIASRLGLTVFVEVKTRMDRAGEAEALASVNAERIGRAAQYYLIRHPDLADTPMRFDVIFLAPFAWPRHVRGAFDVKG